MKLILQSLFLVLILAYMAEFKISFSPFSISFGRGWLVLGFILIMCGCICIKAQGYKDGLEKGTEINKGLIKEVIEEKIKEKT